MILESGQSLRRERHYLPVSTDLSDENMLRGAIASIAAVIS
jgi:hypothetical protein